MADDAGRAGPSRLIHSPVARPVRFPNAEDSLPAKSFTSPVRRSSPLASQSATSTSTNGRRRVHSVNPPNSLPSHPRSRRPQASSFGASQTSSYRDGMSSVMEDSGISLFSDEYDLYPSILQDVQRALKLKARREARLKSANSSPSAKSNSSDVALGSPSQPPKTPPSRTTFPSTSPLPVPPISPTVDELNFGPSTGRSGPRVALHPVPSSSDEGTTLDWSSGGADDDRTERRWTLSITKRKDKEKYPSSNTVETRERMHAAKILQIKSTLSPTMLERATIAREQLELRYKVVYASLPSGGINIVKVAHWFDSLEPLVKNALEGSEASTWLKHLQDRRKTTRRIPWLISALIMNEYVHQMRQISTSQALAEVGSVNSSPNLSLLSRPHYPTSPHGFSFGPSLSRRLSFEGRSPFEAFAESGRTSMDRQSRKSGESTFSSIFSGSSLPLQGAPTSPGNSHFYLIPSRPKSANGSSRSSEHSDDGGRVKRVIPPPLNRDILSGSTVKPTAHNGSIDLQHPLSAGLTEPKTAQLEKPERPSSVASISDLPPTAVGRNFGQRHVRISLPAEGIRQQLEEKRQREIEDKLAHREYELKRQLLAATTAQNSRVRQLLNRIAAGVREFDKAQSTLSTSLNLPYKGVPRDLLDAFSHDPAAVTGATRKYQSWRAVDDIHNRLARQRETFQEFLSCSSSLEPPASGSILEDPITSLMKSLHTLDEERRELAWRATEVSDVLKEVHTVHTEVKTAYNGTLSHTSVIYPEISTIVALEESYKDQYQRFWEFAMDALTFLLDTVTPIWRTYGKTIGDDVQHFLIIPLYRNEFTGEPKRYLIDRFPRRSARHWVGLCVFFFGTVALTFLLGRAAISSTYNFQLLWIPYPSLRRMALPMFWVSILILWWAVAVVSSIVLTQLAVVVWWAGWYVNIFT